MLLEPPNADRDWYYLVGYSGVGGAQLQFALNAANSAEPTFTEAIVVRGNATTLIRTASWPELGVTWTEGGQHYIVQAKGISKADFLRVLDNLAEAR